jgi:hypothetical protein
LAFDDKELSHIDTLIKAAHARVRKFAKKDAPPPLVATVRFISIMNCAERQLQRAKYDRSAEYVAKAELILPIEHRSIESQHRIAITKTHIFLAQNHLYSEKCVHDYLNLLDRNPCFEYRHGLRELKVHYDIEAGEENLLTRKDNSLHVDAAFNQFLTFVTPIGALKGVEGEENPLEEESEVMLSV